MPVCFQDCQWNGDADSNLNPIFKLAWMKSHRGKLRQTRILGVSSTVIVTEKASWHKAQVVCSQKRWSSWENTDVRQNSVRPSQPPNRHSMDPKRNKIRILATFRAERHVRVALLEDSHQTQGGPNPLLDENADKLTSETLSLQDFRPIWWFQYQQVCLGNGVGAVGMCLLFRRQKSRGRYHLASLNM